MTIRAKWNGTVVAESDDTVIVEGNHYFPFNDVVGEYLVPTDTHSTCPWKGLASYYSVVVDGQHNDDAAWYYPEPKAEAENIRDRVAFWRGIEVAPA